MSEQIQLDKKELAKQFVKASVHYGHSPKEWNPKMAPYILYEKYGYHIFDLVKTSKLLKLAGNVLQKKAERNGTFLFVGTNRISSSLIAQQAKRGKSFYINYRWLGGMLTNWSTVQKRIERLKTLEFQELNGSFEMLSKKEYSKVRKEIDRLRRLFNGIKDMASLPDIVIFTNQLKDSLAIKECLRLGIPTICIVDTNCNPDLIPYPIPANDDSSSSINFILNYLVNRINLGYNKQYTTENSN
uniref:Small ribosomal subunit protein uS2c n=1 Tax=Neotessella volvocina TaxID=52559 RepID=A0A3G2QZW6_9STRA|nr:ribosomal protein S2 [Neotessella volvocina]